MVLIRVNGGMDTAVAPQRGAHRGLLVLAVKAKALCLQESITFQPCEGLQQMSALHIVESLSHIHTRSPLEVLSVGVGYFVSSFAFDCRFHGGLVKRGGFDTKKYNKQRKLATRRTFSGSRLT